MQTLAVVVFPAIITQKCVPNVLPISVKEWRSYLSQKQAASQATKEVTRALV